MKTIYKLSMANCSPCKAYAPTFNKLTKAFPEHCWVEADVSEELGASLAKQFSIRSVPATIVIEGTREDVKLGNLTESELKCFVEGI